jgi:uncharacterized protein YjiS (DUF1127 family)
MLGVDLHLANLQRFVQGMRERWRQRSELAALNEAEFGKIAGDLGLTSSDLNRLVDRGPGAADLLYKRLDVLGITRADAERVASGLTRDLERTCACCDHKRACARDLAQWPDGTGWRDYCPNAIAITSVGSSRGRFPT